ncbi:hypothetical protein F441_00930 [Phytophthora nicotianae CJ01A1]|uniref:Uncharacterized protein n=6 Tax=Phytophthora nicotianae TaxID=4792 RepID=W2RH31_PHYN3|nr:hypothetical protein PPTG_00811 [Phytophthora nicotianae INRA-310]ETI56525.1 hypothetical protein F443_00954 [Phytophthora nicotianae P1569]ETK96310.1 hypothetical protein L915_00895 [Phytophthora nicotianae]ETO85199.1 hypothetical protein F444_00963 [Phytophthora nicotianae P1976]ETP26323.1 hypothetical protein F441_00930 [Phytophthora nicotianae CJ01A1]ETP54351.1 hypothetical protein F442_00908 [Phytophthora nicotianae P10297]KUG00348.1 hypothetical protein AM587_10016784 [Phytophthora n
MLSFGTRKKYWETWTEYDLLEEESFALLESILDDENGEISARSGADTIDLDKQYEGLEEEEAFALLESMHDEDDCSMYGQFHTEQQEREKATFELLEQFHEDDEHPVDQDILNMEHQTQGIDPLEMKRLEDAAFALLETILDDDEPIDEDILFQPHKLRQHQYLDSLEEDYEFIDCIVQDSYELNRIEFMFRSIRLN